MADMQKVIYAKTSAGETKIEKQYTLKIQPIAPIQTNKPQIQNDIFSGKVKRDTKIET